MGETKRKHSTVSPSSCERFWNCPGSVRMCEGRKKPSSKCAQEGTNAHFLAETVLRHPTARAMDYMDMYLGTLDKEFLVTEDMVEAVEVYIDLIDRDLATASCTRADLKLEHKFHLTIDEEARGSCDAWFIGKDNKVRVYDYKHGAGKIVEAEENKQMMYYSCGVAEVSLFEDFILTICQPRAREGDTIKSFNITGERLRAWVLELKEHIDATRQADAPVCSGPWCKGTFCDAIDICPAYKQGMSNLLTKNTKNDIVLPNPIEIDSKDIGKILIRAYEFEDMYKAWLSSLVDSAKIAAANGVEIEGFVLSHKMGNRKWINEDEVVNKLGEDAYVKKVKSPAQCKKLLSADEIDAMVTREDKGYELERVTAKKVINKFKEIKQGE